MIFIGLTTSAGVVEANGASVNIHLEKDQVQVVNFDWDQDPKESHQAPLDCIARSIDCAILARDLTVGPLEEVGKDIRAKEVRVREGWL